MKSEPLSSYKYEENISKEKLFKNNSNVITKAKYEMVPPDGGWGWMVVLGSIIIFILGPFPRFGYSILFSPIMISQSVSKTKIAWIFNLHSLTYSFGTIFFGPLCEEFGHRKVAVFGGITTFVSMVLSTFAPSPDFLFFSFGIIGGIGFISSIISCFIIASKYFKKRLGLANGLTSFGGSGSSFLAPLVTNYLLQTFGYKGASLIFAAIILNVCVGAMLYHPVEWHMKRIKSNYTTEEITPEDNISDLEAKENIYNELIQMKSLEDDGKVDASYVLSKDLKYQSKTSDASQTLLNKDKIDFKNNSIKSNNIFLKVLKSSYKNFTSLRYMRVQFIAWAHSGLMLGYITFIMWVPFVLTEAGYSLQTAAWCASLGSIGSISGRVIMTLIADRKFFNVKYGYMLGLFLIGSSIIVFSLVKNIKLFILAIYIWGLGVGFCVSLMSTIIIRVMGVEMLSAVIGVSFLLEGVCLITVGTLSGVVRDASTDYTYTLWMLALSSYIGVFLWLLMPFAERFDEKKYGKRFKKQEEENC